MVDVCVLVIDTEAVTRRVLSSCFDTDGFRVVEAGTCSEARTLLASETPDLVTLDVELGAEDGLALGREIRRDHGSAVIVLSAEDDRGVRIGALYEFADDYILKPFDMREVLARSRAVLRRTAPRAQAQPQPQPQRSNGHNGHRAVEVAGFCLDLHAYRVTVPSGINVELTATEFKLLEALLTNPNRVLSRERLLELSGGNGSVAAYDRAIDMRIGRLREKLGQRKPGAHDFIRTVRGVGYTFAVPSGAPDMLAEARAQHPQ